MDMKESRKMMRDRKVRREFEDSLKKVNQLDKELVRVTKLLGSTQELQNKNYLASKINRIVKEMREINDPRIMGGLKGPKNPLGNRASVVAKIKDVKPTDTNKKDVKPTDTNKKDVKSTGTNKKDAVQAALDIDYSKTMGGSTGPANPLGAAFLRGEEEIKKIYDDEGKIIDLKKSNFAGDRMGQRKAGGMIKKMMGGGKVMKKVTMDKKNSLGKLPTEVRNKMGYMKDGGEVKKKMMGGGMVKKYGHGGKVSKKCPRDGIAMKGKTRA